MRNPASLYSKHSSRP